MFKLRYSENATKVRNSLTILFDVTKQFQKSFFFKFCGLLAISDLYRFMRLFHNEPATHFYIPKHKSD